MTRDHLVPTPSQAQHLVRHCGLAAVQGTQKYSPIAVSKSVCHNHLVAAILATSPSLFLYRISWCYSLAMDIEASPTYQALPEHAKSAWLKAVRALPPAWLLPPATGERFESRDHYLKRLNGYGLYKGFAVISGRVWKEIISR